MIRAIHFISVIKSQNQSVKSSLSNKNNRKSIYSKTQRKISVKNIENNSFIEYKSLLKRVTYKIEAWYQSITEKRKGKFMKDDEFIELQPSPTKFHSRRSTDSDSISSDWSSPKARNEDDIMRLYVSCNI